MQDIAKIILKEYLFIPRIKNNKQYKNFESDKMEIKIDDNYIDKNCFLFIHLKIIKDEILILNEKYIREFHSKNYKIFKSGEKTFIVYVVEDFIKISSNFKFFDVDITQIIVRKNDLINNLFV